MNFEEKCVKFVNHVQKHLDNDERGLKLYKLKDKPNEVGCAICGKTINEIVEELKKPLSDKPVIIDGFCENAKVSFYDAPQTYWNKTKTYLHKDVEEALKELMKTKSNGMGGICCNIDDLNRIFGKGFKIE